MTSPWLKYRNNIYSQNGEDGVLHAIFRELKITPEWVCEFGTLDGQQYSNTFILVQRGVNAVYIESSPAHFETLKKTCEPYPNVITINKFVDYKGEDTLDNILSKTPIPKDFDILSIDIDSSDYQVWKSVELYNPKVVVIEIISSVVPHHITYIYDGVSYPGTGFNPMVILGMSKGYTLLCLSLIHI